MKPAAFQLSRRGFLFSAALAAAGPSRASYAIATISGSAATETRGQIAGVHLPSQVVTLSTDDPQSRLVLTWKGMKAGSVGPSPRLRLALASDLITFQRLEVSLASQRILGTIDLSLGSAFQILEFAIPRDAAAAALRSGVVIRAQGAGSPISLFASGEGVPPEFQPSLLRPGSLSRRDEFLIRFASRVSLTPYGWQEGCVLDGLAALAERSRNGSRFTAALDDHLRLIFPPGLPPRKMASIEGTPCIAQLARKNLSHPEIAATLAFWKSKEDATGAIVDGGLTAAEGNYTVSWPLAALARELKRPDLAAQAIHDLRTRRDRLVDAEGAIWLRYRKDAVPPLTYRLWSRGTAWYLLGLAKTLDALPEPPPDLIAELRRASAYLRRLQCEDGMWRVFAGEPETAPESSGTAGVAAAFAIGARRSWLGAEEKESANRALRGLESRLIPDGLLDAVAPSNRAQGGEIFQRATKGAILQWGMGMLAQLIAELQPPEA